MTNDDLPPCPVCGDNSTPVDVQDEYRENGKGQTWEGETVECNVCHSVIPTAALGQWDERRLEWIDLCEDALLSIQAGRQNLSFKNGVHELNFAKAEKSLINLKQRLAVP